MVNHDGLTLIFSALGDPTRRRILELLSGGERKITDLARPFQMSLPAISKHLRVLERAGLLVRTKQGRVHRMRANPQAMQEARGWLEQYVEGWEQQFDALDRFLRETDSGSGKKKEDSL